MTAVARMAVLDMRTVAPYRNQGLAIFAIVAVFLANRPAALLPALALLLTAPIAAYPFSIADKSGLETLYAVLPVPRRTVLFGHYVWALACFLATAVLGTTLAVALAHAEGVPFGAHLLATVLAASWALFAGNVAIQFPLFIRFGHTRISALATTLPLALIMMVVVKIHPAVASIRIWPPVLAVAGTVAFVISMAVATATDRRRVPHAA